MGNSDSGGVPMVVWGSGQCQNQSWVCKEKESWREKSREKSQNERKKKGREKRNGCHVSYAFFRSVRHLDRNGQSVDIDIVYKVQGFSWKKLKIQGLICD